MHSYTVSDWLPTTPKEAKLRFWDEMDVVLFSGDAYIDHPAFGAAVIGRLIESQGLRVAIVPQPNWRDDLRDFKKFGQPKMFFGVTAGAMDSMVNHYTANRRLRSDDAYTPGDKSGFRPDYAVSTYTKILKKLFPEIPVVIGGVEASLRRVTHYDYWSNTLKPGILFESGADLLVYGMGEQPLLEILKLLKKGVPFENLKNIKQTGFLTDRDFVKKNIDINQLIELKSHEICQKSRMDYASNFKHIEQESNKMEAKILVQNIENKCIVINPPYPTMTEKEIDASFDLPYTRMPHPRYEGRGIIPAYEMIKFSVNMHRGCFGGCAFCTISAHQGKFVASRSKESILREVKELTNHPEFKGVLSDMGGPSANMYGMKGKDLSICAKCVRPSCIQPNICKNLDVNHQKINDVLKEASMIEGVDKVFVGSGIRYDMLVSPKLSQDEQNQAERYINNLVKKHVSGRLKVAPEHTSDNVLKMMRKPSFDLFYTFKEKFERYSAMAKLNQQIIPYFISSHPGSGLKEMADLAVKTKELGFKLEQVQDFTPTPMTLATEIYYSGFHPYTLEKVYTAITQKDKLDQRMFFFWYKPDYQKQIREKLRSLKLTEVETKLLGNSNFKKSVNSKKSRR